MIKFVETAVDMQDHMKRNNEILDIQKMTRFSPYDIKSQMEIKFSGTTTYQDILPEQLATKIIPRFEQCGFRKFKDTLYLFSGLLKPYGMKWEFWRHPEEIRFFLLQINQDIQNLKKRYKQQKQIEILHSQLKMISKWTQAQAKRFGQFLNLCVNHPFIKKNAQILTFVNHCLPINLWNLKIYEQAQISKQSIKTKIFHGPGKKKDFITITSDGIIRSKKNLLQSRVQDMLPFTNQFTCELVTNNSYDMILQAHSFQNQSFKVNFQKEYFKALNIYIGVYNAIYNSELFDIKKNRFQSFSKRRKNCWTKLYNDGQGYFQDLYEFLSQARHQVLITDWWITPYFLLKRPGDISVKTHRLDGVLKRIADRGVKVFIILFREPLNMLCNDSEQAHFYLQSLSRNIKVRRHPIVPQLWSHHQKCCIIDQTYGFMGGLDICFGRWDNPQHSIYNKDDKWNGGDYTNERIRPFVPGTTKNFKESPIDRQKQPRMPWHDIGLHVQGDAVLDLVRHFIQYWNYVTVQKSFDCVATKRSIGKRCQRSYKYQQLGQKTDQEQDMWDTQSQNKKRTCRDKLNMLFYGTKTFFKGPQRRRPQLLIQIRQGYFAGDVQLQLCRSASDWSIGATKTQDSIHRAYQALIEQSENFIYIQNQFFMGKKNKIVSSLAKRIRRAHLQKTNFKVVVVMPLLPGFDGQIDNPRSVPLRVQVHNQFYSINRGQNSLYSQLADLMNFDIRHYIYFFGLRGHAVINNKPVTQVIYVHSKLMIVDDKRAIIGSANINDRSLLGKRDSELAMVIEQNNGHIANKKFEGAIFDLRSRLFNQHFNLTPKQTRDINNPYIWAKIIANAKNSTKIYRKVFGCYPDDLITTAAEISEMRDQAQPKFYQQLVEYIVGHAVQFPLNFMVDEDLEFKFGDKEGIFGQQAFL